MEATPMFGTIGHVRPKPGHEPQIEALIKEWNRDIRPTLPGDVLSLVGQPKERPGEMVFLALMRDEGTYRDLAAKPEQDAWFRRLMEHTEGEPTWEDVQMDYQDRL
jgi:hypothetical protein